MLQTMKPDDILAVLPTTYAASEAIAVKSRQLRHVRTPGMVLVALALVQLLATGKTAPAAIQAEQRGAAGPALATFSRLLYDGSLGGTADTQGMVYLTSPSALATQSFGDGSTTLDTMQRKNDYAGYFAKPELVPILDRAAGFRLSFNLQLIDEAHAGSDTNGDGLDDRAGLSVIILGNDRRGIELGFWQDQVWAQEGGPDSSLFTHAEGASFKTTQRTAYDLVVTGDSYRLLADDAPILGGPLRDYTAFSGVPDPYETPNFIFIGDDTGSAQARTQLWSVTVVGGTERYLPLVRR